MTWVKLTDDWFANRKVVNVSNDARLLYLAALCYSASVGSDGELTAAEVVHCAGVARVKPTAMGELTGWGLWDEKAGGYVIHDFLDYQPSRSKVLANRQARANSGRSGGLAKAAARDPAKSCPVPVPPVTNSSSSSKSPLLEPSDDDAAMTASKKIAAIRLARRETERGPVGSRDAWLQAAANGVMAEVQTAINGGMTVDQAVRRIEPGAQQNPTVAAIENRCTSCGGSGWNDLDDAGNPVACAVCRVPS